jgi:phospholipid-binding lipoprotein MlaA
MRTYSPLKSIQVLLPVAALCLAGCSSLPKIDPHAPPPLRSYQPVGGAKNLIEVNDPIEGFNRGTYKFNYYFDKYLFLPVVRGYRFILPDYAEDRVSSFVDNVYEFNNFFNNLFQWKPKAAGITLGRFAVNTTVGVVGLWDPATGWGMKRQKEDLGQTLGHYGIGNGAYLVLPVLGPSNARDGVGLAGDAVLFSQAGPPAWVDNEDATMGFTAVTAVDTRKRIGFRYQQTGSPFEYELVRMFYTLKRDVQISN